MTERQREEAAAMRSPVGELWESLVLIAITVSSLGAYMGLAFAAVKLFAKR
jgi:hypothetical protein